MKDRDLNTDPNGSLYLHHFRIAPKHFAPRVFGS